MESRMEQYEIMEQIGRGAFGAAILVNHKLEKKKYVLKKIRLARQTDRCRKSAHQEMGLIARLRHPFILEFKEAWVEKGCYICIVTSHCEGGDMAELMKKANGQYFPEETLLKWFTQLLLAVEYLHSNFVLHRDLKCSNIFLTKDQDICLGDYGLAKTLEADDLASTIVGTPNYMCPELLADIPYGFKSDIWSLGCCMYEMTAHRHAFKAFDMAGLVSKINRSSSGPLPQCYSSPLKTLIKSMLRKNPEKRPSATELLGSTFIQPYINQYRPSYNPSAAAKPITTANHCISESHSSSSSCSDRDSLMLSEAMKQGIVVNCHHKATVTKSTSVTNPVLSQPETGLLLTSTDEAEVRKSSNKGQGNKYEMKQPTVIKNIILSLKEGKSKSSRIDYGIKANMETPLAMSEKGYTDSIAHPQETHSLNHQLPVMETPPMTKVKNEVIPLASHQEATEVEINESRPSCSTPSSSLSERLEESSSRGRSESETFQIKSADNCDEEMGPPIHMEIPFPCSILISDVSNCSEYMIHSNLYENCENMSPTASKPDSSCPSSSPAKETLDVKSFRQRAEALEGLLELSADMLRHNRLEELSVILKPFGKEKVSPRDTAIWLAKSLKGMMVNEGGRPS